MHDLPPYEDRCALLHLDTFMKRRSIACVMFIFDVLSGRVNSPNLLSVLDLITPRYPTRGAEFLRFCVGLSNSSPILREHCALPWCCAFLFSTANMLSGHFYSPHQLIFAPKLRRYFLILFVSIVLRLFITSIKL
jgi:hypothetical protein